MWASPGLQNRIRSAQIAEKNSRKANLTDGLGIIQRRVRAGNIGEVNIQLPLYCLGVTPL